LAGNKAYYDAKSKNAGAGHIKIKQSAEPACLQKFKRKINKIASEVQNLAPRSDVAVSGLGVARFCAYCDWLRSVKEDLRAEFTQVINQSISEGLVVTSSEIKDWNQHIENLVLQLQTASKDLERQWREAMKTSNYDDQTKIINQAKASFEVSNTTFKLVEIDNSKPAQANLPRNSMPPPQPPKTHSGFTKKDFFLCRGSETFGPYVYTELLEWLKTGNVVDEDLVACDGATSWITIRALIEQVEANKHTLD
jgi:hypothetical protein